MSGASKPQRERNDERGSVGSVSKRRLSDEEYRILLAAQEGTLYLSSQGRWQIQGEEVPDRRTRENLVKRFCIAPVGRWPQISYRITPKGKTAFDREIRARVEERRVQHP